MIDGRDTVELPVGLLIEGNLYKKVVIAEMNGYDEENMASRAIRNNGAKAQSILLRRCIQEIEGLVPRKQNPNELIKQEYVLAMTTYDRDFLFYSIRAMDGTEPLDFSLSCEACGTPDQLSLSIQDLQVYDWEGDKQQIEFEMSKGIFHDNAFHKEGVWRFLTGRDQEKLATLPDERTATTSFSFAITKLGTMPFAPTEEMYRRLTSRERLEIIEEIASMSPGVQSTIEHVCSSCGAESRFNVDVSRFFRSPTSQEKKPLKRGKNNLRKLRRT